MLRRQPLLPILLALATAGSGAVIAYTAVELPPWHWAAFNHFVLVDAWPTYAGLIAILIAFTPWRNARSVSGGRIAALAAAFAVIAYWTRAPSMVVVALAAAAPFVAMYVVLTWLCRPNVHAAARIGGAMALVVVGTLMTTPMLVMLACKFHRECI